jgi:hypothetical protein
MEQEIVHSPSFILIGEGMGCMEEAGEALGSVLEIVVVPLRSHD